jgi:hypothetical protein
VAEIESDKEAFAELPQNHLGTTAIGQFYIVPRINPIKGRA